MKNLFYSLIILLKFSSPGLAQTADEFNTKGMEFFKEGKINEAIQELQNAIKQDTTFVKAYINLGYIYYAHRILDYAIPLYKKALTFEPESALAHNNLGAALLANRNYAEAINEYRLAIQYDSTYTEAHNNLAFAYYSVGLQDFAIKEAETALKLNPDYARAYNNLGLAYGAKSMFDEAEVHFKKALELAPNFIDAMNNLGIVLRSKNMYQESLEVLAKAEKLDSLNIDTFNNLGLTHLSNGEIHKAIENFKKVLKIVPNYGTAHNNLSFAYYDIYNYAMAMQHAKAAERFGLKINPDFIKDLEKALDPDYFRMRHILVKTQEEAGKILQQLKQDGDFAELALNHSIDKNTASQGGDFGYFKKGDMQPELEQVVLKLKKNETSEVVKTALGFHIFERLK